MIKILNETRRGTEEGRNKRRKETEKEA